MANEVVSYGGAQGATGHGFWWNHEKNMVVVSAAEKISFDTWFMWGSLGIVVASNIKMTGWWFQTFFIFHNIWDNPSHWLIFFKMVQTTNQMMLAYMYHVSRFFQPSENIPMFTFPMIFKGHPICFTLPIIETFLTIINHPPVIIIFMGGINHQTWGGLWHCFNTITPIWYDVKQTPIQWLISWSLGLTKLGRHLNGRKYLNEMSRFLRLHCRKVECDP